MVLEILDITSNFRYHSNFRGILIPVSDWYLFHWPQELAGNLIHWQWKDENWPQWDLSLECNELQEMLCISSSAQFCQLAAEISNVTPNIYKLHGELKSNEFRGTGEDMFKTAVEEIDIPLKTASIFFLCCYWLQNPTEQSKCTHRPLVYKLSE